MCMKQKAPKVIAPAKVAAPAAVDQADLQLTEADTASSTKNKKRKGKAGMTVSRKGVQYAGGGSGLNIPNKA